MISSNKYIRLLGITIFAYLGLQAAGYLPTHYQTLINFLITILIYLVCKKLFSFDTKNHWKIFLLILILGGGLRFLQAIYVPTTPVRDFAFYNSWALEFSSTGVHDALPKNYLYPFILSLGYRIYPDPLTGRLINALVSTTTIGMVYLLARELTDSRTALTASLLIAFFPSEIDVVSLLGTESFTAAVLVLIGLVFVLGIKVASKWWYFLIAGALFGLGFHLRSSIIFYFPLLVLFGLCSRIERSHKINAIWSLFAGIVLVQALLIFSHSLLIGKFTLASVSTQDSFPILSGTNFDYSGTWNEPDAKLYFSWPEEDRDRLARLEAFRRITNNPLRFIRTIITKYSVLFMDNTFGGRRSLTNIDWSRLQKFPFLSEKILIKLNASLSQATYFAIWGFGLVSFMKRKVGIVPIIALSLVVFTLLPHSIVEVQPRYHHYIMPYLIMASSTGLAILVRVEIALKDNEN